MVAVVGITVWRIADDRLLVQVPLSIVAIGAAWYWMTRTGVRRSIAIALSVTIVEGPFDLSFHHSRLPGIRRSTSRTPEGRQLSGTTARARTCRSEHRLRPGPVV
ncbi:MAG: hypothetical protein ACXWFT_12640 [Actinomycetota bacterium]